MIRDDMSNEEYHASDAVSSSAVKTVLKSSVWHWKNQVQKETTAMIRGTAVHDFALEGGKNTVRGPETRRGNAWKEAVESAEGKTVLPEKEYDEAQQIAKALFADPACKKQLNCKDGKKEYSLFATCPETALNVRIRPDIYNPTDMVMSDIKTTVDASPKGFNREIYSKWRYDVQAAFYKYVAELCGWKVMHFAFLAVESNPPHAAHMHVMSLDAMSQAHQDMMFALEQIAEAKVKDDYSLNWGKFTMIHPPSWMDSYD